MSLGKNTRIRIVTNHLACLGKLPTIRFAGVFYLPTAPPPFVCWSDDRYAVCCPRGVFWRVNYTDHSAETNVIQPHVSHIITMFAQFQQSPRIHQCQQWDAPIAQPELCGGAGKDNWPRRRSIFNIWLRQLMKRGVFVKQEGEYCFTPLAAITNYITRSGKYFHEQVIKLSPVPITGLRLASP